MLGLETKVVSLIVRVAFAPIKVLSVCFISLFFNFCTPDPSRIEESDSTRVKTVDYKSFKNHKKLQFTNTGISLGTILEMAVLDSFLICSDLRTTKILHVINIRSNKYLGQILTRGKGKGECLSVANILPTSEKNMFWAYDITLGKLLKIDIRKALKDKSYLGEKEYILSDLAKAAKSPNWINDSLFVSCSYKIGDSRFYYFNDQSKIIKKVGQLPAAFKEWPKPSREQKLNLRSMAFKANIERHPSSNIFVVAYNTADRIEYYKGSTLKKIIIGPDQFQPVYDFREEGQGIFTPVSSFETRYAHMQIFSTNKHFFSLYSGGNNFQTCGSKILVFDWNGNPQSIWQLDKKCCSFAVFEKNDTVIRIYSVDTSKEELIFADITS